MTASQLEQNSCGRGPNTKDLQVMSLKVLGCDLGG